MLLLLLSLTVSLARSQDSTLTYNHPSRFVLKLAPLAVLDQDATLQAGLEYRTGRRTSVQAELGYGGKNLSPFQSDIKKFTNAEVWRGRAEVRFYRGRYRTNRKQGLAIRSDFPLGNYWAVEGLFKQINVTTAEYIGQLDPVTRVSIIIYPQNISRYVVGSHIKFGRQFAFYDPHRRVFSRALLDIYWGMGVRLITNQGAEQLTVETCGCGFGRSFTRRGITPAPSLSLGLKLSFAL